MSTKAKNKKIEAIENYLQIYDTAKPPETTKSDTLGNNLTQVMDAMKSVDTKSPEAQANATSIADNNGGRIELNEDLKNPKIIKK